MLCNASCVIREVLYLRLAYIHPLQGSQRNLVLGVAQLIIMNACAHTQVYGATGALC